MNTQNNNEYLLLIRDSNWHKNLPAAELQKVMDDVKAWFERLGAEGRVKGGQPLALEGAVVSGKSGRLVADGPFAESKEAIGGYVMLTADSLEEAIAIAKTAPMLGHGHASIEVRQIADECPSMAAYKERLAREGQLAHA